MCRRRHWRWTHGLPTIYLRDFCRILYWRSSSKASLESFATVSEYLVDSPHAWSYRSKPLQYVYDSFPGFQCVRPIFCRWGG